MGSGFYRTASTVALAIGLWTTFLSPSWAITSQSNADFNSSDSNGYTMLHWSDSGDIVEQMQSVQRLSQLNTPNCVTGLVCALSSPHELVRRTSARTLFEKGTTLSLDQQQLLVEQVQASGLNISDPMVQKTLVCLLAELKTPEARAALQTFFHNTPKESQLNAVNALAQEAPQHPEALKLASRLSPYNEVRQAALENLH